MASLAIYLTGTYLLGQLLAPCTADLNWSEECQLIPDRNDLTKEFRLKASEKGVELVYLNLDFGNDSYNRLEGHADLFLPDRWVYARSIGNPMLSLSYNYDVLSLSLLNYQVRSMAVPLKDHPSGCLARLNSSSLPNRVIGKTLLNVTNSANKISHDAHVVCVSVIFDVSVWYNVATYFKSNVEYKCCVIDKNSEGILCEQSVEIPGWMQGFVTVLDILTVVMILYCAASLLLLPKRIVCLEEELVKEERLEKQENQEHKNTQSDGERTRLLDGNELEMLCDGSTANDQMDPPDRSEYESLDERLVYVDDERPITCSTLLKECLFSRLTKGRLDTKLSFNIKLIIICYCVIPFFFLINLLIGLTIKRRFFDEASKKENAALDGFQHFYSVVFRVGTSKDVTEMLMVTVAPYVSILFSSPKKFLFFTSESQVICKCFICKEAISSVEEDMRLHLKKWRRKIYTFAIELMKVYSDIIIAFGQCAGPCERQIRRPCRSCRKALIGALFILPFYAVFLIICLILGAVALCIFLVVSAAYSLWYSPFFCLQNFLSTKITESLSGLTSCMVTTDQQEAKLNNIVNAVLILPCTFVFLWLSFYSFIFMSLSPAYLLASLSCRFVVRVFGLTVMGLVLNKEIATPFLAFIFVATGNIFLCYGNFQKGYKEVTEMISNYWRKELPRRLRKSTGGKDAFPESLFLHICGLRAIEDHKVLPIISELYRMLLQIASILIFLFLILCIVLSFGRSNDISVWATTLYMFASGVISGLFFKRITKGKKFFGARKRKIKKKIKSAVKDYAKVFRRQAASPNGNEVDLSEFVIVYI